MSTDRIVFEEKNEQFGFTQLPNVVLTSTVLNPTEVRIYAILRRYASMPNGAMPSVPTICAEANISKTTYSRAIKTFIRSAENPRPKIPLITAIHRSNKSNVFKVHKITDALVEKLKPTVSMSEKELEPLKEKHKSKKPKSRFQNETPIENTREFQNDTPRVGFKMKLRSVSNRNTSNIELSNIDNNKEQKDVVVVLQNQIKEKFDSSISRKMVNTLVDLFEDHGKPVDESMPLIEEIMSKYQQAFGVEPTIKDVITLINSLLENDRDFDEVLNGTIEYFERKKQSIHNPVGVLINAMEKGFVSAPKQNDEPKRYGTVEETKKLLEMYE